MKCPRCGDNVSEDSLRVREFYICHDCGCKVPNPQYIPVPTKFKPSKPSKAIRFRKTRSCIRPNAQIPKDMVSIIILTYNTRQVTANCVKSVLAKTRHPYELIVVDNASRDGTVELFSKQSFMKLIANTENMGFSKGNNKGIRRARGKHVCLLNSDIIVKRLGWLGKMVKIAESDGVGTVGAKLLYPNGTIQHVGGGIHHLNPYHPYDRYHPNVKGARVNRDVPYNTGACLLITRTALDKVGLLDEGYPFGFEDVDYGLRVVEKGLRNVCCVKAVLTHLWAYTQRTTGRYLKTPSLRRYHLLWDSKLPELAKKIELDWGAPYCV